MLIGGWLGLSFNMFQLYNWCKTVDSNTQHRGKDGDWTHQGSTDMGWFRQQTDVENVEIASPKTWMRHQSGEIQDPNLVVKKHRNLYRNHVKALDPKGSSKLTYLWPTPLPASSKSAGKAKAWRKNAKNKDSSRVYAEGRKPVQHQRSKEGTYIVTASSIEHQTIPLSCLVPKISHSYQDVHPIQ